MLLIVHLFSHFIKARTTPLSSGATEHEIAFRDLQQAFHLAPENPAVVSAYKKLKVDLKLQKEKDKDTFQGLFQRGEIVTPDEKSTSTAARGEEAEGHQTVEIGTKNQFKISSVTGEEPTMTIQDALDRMKVI